MQEADRLLPGIVLIGALHALKQNKSKTSVLMATELEVFDGFSPIYYMMMVFGKPSKRNADYLQFCSFPPIKMKRTHLSHPYPGLQPGVVKIIMFIESAL